MSRLATGMDLGPMGKAPNKGMCGLSARYFDASFAFISAHFTSDSKGRNRLARRNNDARTVLKELALVGDAGFDVQNMHHHGEGSGGVAVGGEAGRGQEGNGSGEEEARRACVGT